MPPRLRSRRSPLAQVALWLVAGYRSVISPLLPPSCRYAPSCSEYAFVAIERFGAIRGSWLALRRLLRCGPWHRGGFDPVPERTDRCDRTDSPDSSDRTHTPELEPQP